MKKANLKRDFGITLEYYHELLESQNECCAICGKPEVIKTQRGNVRMLSVDHDHTTREVRGLLCMKCNSLIGHAKEEVSILERAIAYLKKYK
jgi:ribosomal protein L34E